VSFPRGVCVSGLAIAALALSAAMSSTSFLFGVVAW
jgi:hypothetical protein